LAGKEYFLKSFSSASIDKGYSISIENVQKYGLPLEQACAFKEKSSGQ
jgi:hypothetical protein